MLVTDGRDALRLKRDVYLDPKNDFLIENINPGTGIKDIDKIHLVESQNNIRCIILNKNQLTWDEIHKLI